MKTYILIFSLCLSYLAASPIVTKYKPQDFNPRKGFCFLPGYYGFVGVTTFLEDCPYKNLSRYDTLPMIAIEQLKEGVHPKVCCPEALPEDHVCTPSDPWCPSYVAPEKEKFIEKFSTLPTVGKRSCKPFGSYANLPNFSSSDLTECVTLNRCGALLNDTMSPLSTTLYCGFDEESQMMMMCCPPDLVTEPIDYKISPRFPGPDGKGRQIEDRTELCGRWKDNRGCDLDRNILIGNDRQNGKLGSRYLFDFMTTACMKSCGWADKKGCVDEHPRCPEWARNGLCNQNSFFMAHTCRESCGVCGFLSPFNTEDQEVHGASYSDYNKGDFKCGEGKLLCEINNEDCEGKNFRLQYEESETKDETINFDLRETDDSAAFSFDPSEPHKYYCGSTIVTDRDKTPNIESIEIKKIYKHPLYRFPNLYNDIAVVELGRRIEYDYDKLGDSPTCLDKGQDNTNRLATVQGYGDTVDGGKGTLLETNVTIISNDQCQEYLKHNSTLNKEAKRQIDEALPNGLNGMMCGQGIWQGEYTVNGNLITIFSGACKGDSGGPLTTGYVSLPEDRSTLVGIVSGGIGCGKGVPGWYTKVSFFYKWIDCVINTSKETGGVQSLVTEKCDKVAQDLVPKCINEDDLVFGDLRSDEDFLIPSC